MHGDLCGPITPPTPENNKYVFVLINDFSRYMWVIQLKEKSEAYDRFKRFKESVEKQTRSTIKTFRTDRGGEFTLAEFNLFSEENVVGTRRSKSIAAHAQPSIDAHIPTSTDARLALAEDRLQSFTYHLDGVYYPLRDDTDSLTTHLNALQQEIDTIQRLLDFQAEPLPSIDRWTRPSIDNDYTRS